MNRGEIWLATFGRKTRPVLVLTRSEVLDVRALVTVAEISTSVRGLAVEVAVDTDIGLKKPLVINCDGIHTIAQSALTKRAGVTSGTTMRSVGTAVTYALGCL